MHSVRDHGNPAAAVALLLAMPRAQVLDGVIADLTSAGAAANDLTHGGIEWIWVYLAHGVRGRVHVREAAAGEHK